MTYTYGQAPYFDYDKSYLFRRINRQKIKVNFGNTITIGNTQYVASRRYNRRYIFSYINNSFVLDSITQCPRRGQFPINKPTSAMDTSLLNSKMNNLNLQVNNSDPFLNQLPPVIDNQFLMSIFNFQYFYSDIKYFIDCIVNKRLGKSSPHPNYFHPVFTIPEYYINVGRYGLLEYNNNEVIIFRERKQSRKNYI
jgi:hypothetical protein